MLISMSGFQQLGRALMLPIAVLPAAGLLLRLGQPDMLDIAFMAQSGQALFANLGLLFAIGVAVGFAKEGHGAAALAGTVCYLVTTFGSKAFIPIPPEVIENVAEALHDLVGADYKNDILARLSVPIGIISGLLSGLLYNRFSTIALPEYLAFFGGKRFVPIAAACAGMVLACMIGLSIEGLNLAVDWMSRKVVDAGSFGLFIYGTLNRILIITGLHHILNNIAWFVIGEYQGATGDLNRFFASDPEAGGFMAGFFPVMMFGLPAACFAMYRAARPERRREVGGMLGSMALTSFLTGVTEPIEFTFMFLAPVLYAVHAVLTGLSMAVMDILSVKLGFGFSAGMFDYLINFKAATRPLWLLPIGLIYAALYYGIFSFAIRRFNLATPGRESVDSEISIMRQSEQSHNAEGYLQALGGVGNLTAIEACTTRLRLGIVNGDMIDEAALKQMGAKGIIRPSSDTMQVIIGPQAEQIADSMRASTSFHRGKSTEGNLEVHSRIETSILASKLLSLLGGTKNISEASLLATNRLIVKVVDSALISKDDLEGLGVYPFEGETADGHSLHLYISDPSLVRI